LLVYNDPLYDLMVTYNQLDPDMDTLKFCNLLGISREYFENALDKNWRSGRYSKSVPFVFYSKIPAETFAYVQESLYDFPGFYPQLRNVRGYPHHNAAHVLGYIREVNASELEEQGDFYSSGDYIGATGLEKTYEQALRGKKGVRYVLRDNLGREVGTYKDGSLDSLAESGRDLISTIDLDLQRYGEELMKNKKGSIVAIAPSTGEVLAMISTPTYDPNRLTISQQRAEVYRQLLSDSLKPFFNRAVSAQYPPGSLFKPVVALIAMQEEVLNPGRTMKCPGAYYANEMRLTGCHDHPTCYNVSQAIQYSCNAYFVTVFRDVVDKFGFYNPQEGLDRFNDYLDDFGIGTTLGIDFPVEEDGNYPTSDYFDKWYEDQKWNSIWIRSLGIGQGELLMTNLQMANLAAIIANRGFYYPPHLLRGFKDSDYEIADRFRQKRQVAIDSSYYEPVVEGMARVVTAGTARLANIWDIPVCGKTGTAENPHGEDHSIFFGFAPRDNPQIAVAVYVENGGWGGSYAAPIASLMMEQYIRGSILDSRKWLEQRMVDADLLEKP
ncbi:MAG: penicillin-binding transpeptidase domain-containing protein, partial [Saprospiraceae bacterium]|nr:penicillin-binding transpeptidase domain-containing protein [Saprospiraceae bacterium]